MRGTLLTYPIRVNDYLDDGGTENDISAWHGNFMQALVIGMHRYFEVRDAYEQTAPSMVTLYAFLRRVAVPTNGAAVSKLVSKA